MNLNTTLAKLIHVQIEAGYKLCYNAGNGRYEECYLDYFEVYIYPGKYKLQDNKNVYSYFKPLYNITNNTSPTATLTRTTQTFSFNQQNYSQGVTLAFRSKGACGSIFKIKMYHYYCEETINDALKFERTLSPAEGFKNITGNCSENSVPSNNFKTRYCYSNGTWGELEHGNLECFCVEGYEPNKTDGSCSSKLHL